MRNLAFLSLAIIALGISSCDKVDNPYLAKATGAKPTIPPSNVDSTNTSSANWDTTFRILVEDYTGHHCTNCPTAAGKCEILVNQHPSQVVLMEVNTNNPLGAPYLPVGSLGSGVLDSAYLVDYRSKASYTWDPLFINSGNNGIPATMVNRLYFTTVGGAGGDLFLHGIDPTIPGDSLINQNNHLATIHIVDSMYMPPTSTVSMSITAKILNPVGGNKYYLVVGLVEDSIVDWQDSSNNDVQYYLKRMTLRTTINNDGGSGLGDSLVATNSPQTKHYVYTNTQSFKYNSAIIRRPTSLEGNQWNMAHMYVVAFVYQVTTGSQNYMVLQAQQLHL